MRRLLFFVLFVNGLLLVSCGSSSLKSELEQRKAALRQKQDSTLEASQRELAMVDSALEAVKREYEQMQAEVDQHKAQLKATSEELTGLTRLRLKRDSLQVQWDLLGAKIKYIRLKQREMDDMESEK